jgi:hypothetical protein
MSFNIKNFKSNLLYGGARTNLFEVQMGYPPGLNISDENVELNQFSRKLKFLCKSAFLPSTSIDAVTVPYQGREVYTAGTKVFDPFTITVINDEDFYIRKTFEFWVGAMNGHSSNIKNSGVNSSPSSYQVDGVIKQFSQTSLGPPYVERNSIKQPVKYESTVLESDVYDPANPDRFIDRRFSRNSATSKLTEVEPIPIRTYKFVNMFPISVGSIELSWEDEKIEEFSVTFKYDYWVIGPNS